MPQLTTKATSSVIDNFERKISERGMATRAVGKVFTLLISNEDIVDIMRNMKSLENSDVLIYGVTETVKHQMKKLEGRFLGDLLVPMTVLLVAPVASSLVK